MLMALLAVAAAPDDGCGSKSSQTAMNMCSGASATRVEAELNRVWKLAYAAEQKQDRDLASDRDDPHRPGKGEPGYAATLLTAQRAWLAFRDAQCRVERYQWAGGTMAPFAENECMVDLTQTRIRQLRYLLDPK